METEGEGGKEKTGEKGERNGRRRGESGTEEGGERERERKGCRRQSRIFSVTVHLSFLFIPPERLRDGASLLSCS